MSGKLELLGGDLVIGEEVVNGLVEVEFLDRFGCAMSGIDRADAEKLIEHLRCVFGITK